MRFCIVILVLALSFSGYCQDFVSGYIVSPSGDTTTGFIQLNSQAKNYKTCVFKKDSISPRTVYTPYNLSAYGNKNMLYQSKDIVDNNIIKRIFAEVLLDGTFNLIKYKSFFIEKEDSVGIILLKNKMDAKSRDQLKRFSYTQVLQVLSADCPSLINELKHLKLSEQGVLNYIEQYHQCKNYPYKVYKNNLPWTVFNWWPFAGYHISSLSSTNFFERSYLNPAISYGPVIGSSLQFNFPRTNKNLTLILDIMFSRSLFQSQTKIASVGESYTYEYLSLKLNTLKIPVGVSMPIRVGSEFKIEGGIGLNFYKGNPQFTYESFSNGQVFIDHQIEKRESPFMPSFYVGLRHRLTFSNFQLPISLRLDQTPKLEFRKSSLISAYLTIGLTRSR